MEDAMVERVKRVIREAAVVTRFPYLAFQIKESMDDEFQDGSQWIGLVIRDEVHFWHTANSYISCRVGNLNIMIFKTSD